MELEGKLQKKRDKRRVEEGRGEETRGKVINDPFSMDLEVFIRSRMPRIMCMTRDGPPRTPPCSPQQTEVDTWTCGMQTKTLRYCSIFSTLLVTSSLIL